MKIKFTLLALITLMALPLAQLHAQQKETVKHTFNALPYAYDALEKIY